MTQRPVGRSIVTLPALCIGMLLLYPRSWFGSRGTSGGGKWAYRCPDCPSGNDLVLRNKPSLIPVCATHHKRMQRVH
jgi:hypothetical protein